MAPRARQHVSAPFLVSHQTLAYYFYLFPYHSRESLNFHTLWIPNSFRFQKIKLHLEVVKNKKSSFGFSSITSVLRDHSSHSTKSGPAERSYDRQPLDLLKWVAKRESLTVGKNTSCTATCDFIRHGTHLSLSYLHGSWISGLQFMVG